MESECITQGKEGQNKGITLIALVITIIILLILAGISIIALTNSGLFDKAKEARKTHIKAQLKEEIEMAIMDIQIEEIAKGHNLTLETLANGQLESKLEEITAEFDSNEINGEYKEYEYKIDSNLHVIIGDSIKDEISFSYILEPKGYTRGNITLTVNAKSTNGTIESIESNGLTQNSDGTYTISENGTYTFIVKDSSGATKNKTVNINKIDKLDPVFTNVSIDDYTENGFTVYVSAEDIEDEQGGNTKSGIDKCIVSVGGYEKVVENR